jgi:hypothetical protein
MRHLKKVIVMPILIGLIFSCEQKNEIKPDRLGELTTQVVSSAEFNRLQLTLSDLNLAGSQYVDVHKNSIAIPFVGRDDRKGVVAMFDENDVLRGLMEFEALTNVDSDHMYVEFRDRTLNGTFAFRTGLGKMVIQLENSRPISSSMARTDGSAFACRLWDEVIACAYFSFDQMNYLDQTICILSFAPCIARLVLLCLLDGCMFNFA